MDQTADHASQAPSRRFVVQHHETADGEHWDLMLEQADGLLTWQVFTAPEHLAGGPAAARRIGEHRKAYLTYEGPISRGRGTVHIVERGTYRLLERGPDLLRFELRGRRRLHGRFVLSRTDAETEEWVLTPAG